MSDGGFLVLTRKKKITYRSLYLLLLQIMSVYALCEALKWDLTGLGPVYTLPASISHHIDAHI